MLESLVKNESRTVIAAIATPMGTGGIGIIRLSGPEAWQIAIRVFRPATDFDIEKARGYSGRFGHVFDGEGDIDEAILFLYRTPKSYTGEDTAEISCHGGIYLQKRILSACLSAGAALAEPGEFTKRAFLNGKLSLTQAEGIMELIGAQGRQAAQAALAMHEGHMYRTIREIVEKLIVSAGHLAAWVDYPEEDVEAVSHETLFTELSNQRDSLSALLVQYETGQLYRNGVEVAIAGKPNVGKSTLMNWLSGWQKSIITDIPGTTRDVVEEHIQLDGIVLHLADTAGIRQTEDPIESEGVIRAKKCIDRAQLVLAVFDASQAMEKSDWELLEIIGERPAVVIINKTDLGTVLPVDEIRLKIPLVVEVSLQTGEGAGAISGAIREALQLGYISGDHVLIANERQRRCVAQAVTQLEEAREALKGGVTLDAVHVCIEQAIDTLLELTGERASDAIIDEVFARFCVGK